jgi:AAA+ ATPase superfamily predicted ATPase
MNRKNTKVFIGRKQELDRLNSVAMLSRSAIVVIKGRRRVGKSRLVTEYAKDKIFLPFAGMAPVDGVSAQDQYDAFANTISALFHIPPFTFTNWLDGFANLAMHLGDKPTVILFDEISWMGSKDPTFLPKLKMWWDKLSEQKSNIILILCGSVSTWIEKNIIKSTAFFGRVTLHITLNPLSLSESYTLLQKLNVKCSAYDTFRILSITGGIPWYLENIQANQSIDENLKRLCFSPNGLLVDEFNLIFHDLFDRRGDVYKKIVATLAQGMRDYAQIREALHYSEGGGLYPYIDALITSGYITKHQGWSIRTGKPAKKSLFRLSDNYLRFYIKVIEPHLSRIHNHAFQDISLSSIPGWNSLMGLQIENLLLVNRRQVLQAIGVHPQDVLLDNPFLQHGTKSQEGVQIDYLVQSATKTLYLCEFKFNRNELKSDVIKDVQTKKDKLYVPKGFSICPVLFHFGGVSESVIDSQFFYKIVDISDFLGEQHPA